MNKKETPVITPMEAKGEDCLKKKKKRNKTTQKNNKKKKSFWIFFNIIYINIYCAYLYYMYYTLHRILKKKKL